MISFFRAPIRNITPEAQVSVLQIYKYITSDYAKVATERLRSMSDHVAARRFKSEMLDYVTFSGCFSSRRTGHLLEHSGFLCFDIDKIESEERLQEIKSLLINDEELHTVLCFRSPSGNGLKWVVEVPDRYSLRSCTPYGRVDSQLSTDNRPLTFCDKREQPSLLELPSGAKITTEWSNVDCRQSTIDVIVGNHRMLYERIRGYLFERYDIETDHTSDIARPCYLCHDDDAYYDEPKFKDNPASKLLASLVSTDNITRFARDFCSAQHSTSKLDSAFACCKKSTDNKLHKTDTNQKTVDCSQNLNPDGDCRPSTVDFRQNNYENDIEKIVRDIERRSLDITDDYHNWMLVAMALAGTYGSAGEGYFHRISQYSSKYDNKEAHRMYQSCLRNNNGLVGIGTIVYLIHNS